MSESISILETEVSEKVWTPEEREAARQVIACKSGNAWPASNFVVDLQCELNAAWELLKRCSDFSMLPLSLGAAMQEWLERNKESQ